MKTEEDFRKLCKKNRLRWSVDEDGSTVVVSRNIRGYSRGRMYFHGPDVASVVAVDLPAARSRKIAKSVAEAVGQEANYLQGQPPGEWVGTFPAEHLLDVASRLGMVRQRVRSEQADRLRRRTV